MGALKPKAEDVYKRQPPIKFKDLDLEQYMSQHKLLNGPYFPFDVRTDYVKVTDDTVPVSYTHLDVYKRQ